jgi:hypothetical protein
MARTLGNLSECGEFLSVKTELPTVTVITDARFVGKVIKSAAAASTAKLGQVTENATNLAGSTGKRRVPASTINICAQIACLPLPAATVNLCVGSASAHHGPSLSTPPRRPMSSALHSRWHPTWHRPRRGLAHCSRGHRGPAERSTPAGCAGAGPAPWNPELLREGFAIQDRLVHNRFVYGVDGPPADADITLLDRVYAAPLDSGKARLVTDFPTAELVKVAANAFLATKISFINAMAEMLRQRAGSRWIGRRAGRFGGIWRQTRPTKPTSAALFRRSHVGRWPDAAPSRMSGQRPCQGWPLPAGPSSDPGA